MQLTESKPLQAEPVSIRASWTRFVVPTLALSYLGVVLLAPLVGLVEAVWESGLGEVLTALNKPAAIEAIKMTEIGRAHV